MRKPMPGFRMFRCDSCGHKWKEPSRDCHSPSIDSCPNYGIGECDYGMGEVIDWEEHPEWPMDNGNLIRDFDYLNYKG